MKAADVVRQLRACLPRYSDDFTDTVGVVSIVSVGLLATVTTTVDHNLVNNDFVHIWGCLIPNAIIQLTQLDGVATAITANDNDLTENYEPDTNVTIVGANEAGYNGSHKLLRVLNRRTFEFEVDNATPSPATGSPLLLEDLKRYTYNGYHEITVVSSTQFTFALEKELGSPAYGDITLKVKPRITATATIDEAVRSYTKQFVGKLVIYVVLDNIIASKDRSEGSDAVFIQKRATDTRQLIIQQFHVYVFSPNKENITNRSNRDKADDVLALLTKCILGTTFQSSLQEESDYGTVFARSDFVGFESDSSIVYVHDFVFEQSSYISFEDAVDTDKSVALRDIYGKYTSDFIDDNEIKFEGNTNLDDEPLT